MAVLNFAITVPDGQVARLRAAARETWGAALTNAEIEERFRQELITLMKSIVRSSERKAALLAAEALEPVVDAT